MDRDRFMSADEAKDYGLIDHVISNLKQIETVKGDKGTRTARTRRRGKRARACAH